MNGDLTYNTNDLQTYDAATRVGIITNSIEHTNIPDKNAQLVGKADANGSVIPAINYPSKIIIIAGAIVGSTQDDLDSRIDTFKAYFNARNANLDIDYGGTTRRYIATATSVSVSRQQKALHATFQVEFACTQPFGEETTATNIANETAYTAATLTETPTIGGTAPYQLPITTVTINALTGTADYIQLTNDLNGQTMIVSGLGFAADDVLIIDAANRSVTLNDVEVDYFGTFLELEPGANSLTYTDGFTTRDVDILIEYYKRYL